MNNGKIANALKTICDKLGKENDPVIAVIAIAVFKMIMRPIFTLADKKQSKKDREYAAFREGLTEMIAIPSYLSVHFLTKEFLAPKIHKLATKVAMEAEKRRPELMQNLGKLEDAKNVMSFLGVCVTALIIIPFLCNLAITPAMDKFRKYRESKSPEPLNPNPVVNPVKTINTPASVSISTPIKNSLMKSYLLQTGGLKVGG